MRWSIAMWRGWLWKLTGVALPIETVKKVKPTSGAFAAIPGKTADGGWKITVDKNGITLVYCEPAAIAPALFDYLRMAFGCAFYAPDFVKKPDDGSVKELSAFTREAKPHYRLVTCGTPWILTSGGWDPQCLYARNDVDYYHLYDTKWDHCMNVILPGEIYFKSHPEYFMLAKNGKRFVHPHPHCTNPCFSSKEGMNTIVENLMKYADEQPLFRRITMETGDVWEHCQCPECVKLNGGTDTNSDSRMHFANLVAKALAKRHPDKVFEYGIYATRHTVPKHVKYEGGDHVNFWYCLTGQEVPCTMHIDCQYNRDYLDELAAWYRYLGKKRERIGYMTYLDIRPLRHLRQMQYLNQFGSGEVYLFDFHGFPISSHFMTARWNLGEDPDKLMEEFDLNYFGKGGEAMHKITLIVDEYASKYEHTPDDFAHGNRHFGIWGGSMKFTRTALTREMFDKIYALFDEAMAAVKGDRAAERRILNEIKLYMAADLHRYNINTCKNEEELKAFADRLCRFILLAQKYPECFRQVSIGVDLRQQINGVSGMAIPEGGFWANQPVVKKFLEDPMQFFFANPEKIPGGWYFRPLSIRGAGAPIVYTHECPERQCTALTRQRFKNDAASITLTLDKAPTAPLLLCFEGMDDEKPGTSLLEVSVNDRVIFSDKNLFPEHTWGRVGLTLPADALKKGDNRITFRNITPDRPSRSALFGDTAQGETDSQWGWQMISEAWVLDPAGDFARYAAGEPRNAVWHLGYPAKPPKEQGEVINGDGKVVLKGVEGSPTGIVYFASHDKPKLATAPGSRVRMSVNAAGKGTLRMLLWVYRPQQGTENSPKIPVFGYCGGTGGVQPLPTSAPMLLNETKQELSCELAVPQNAGLFIPRIELDGTGEATLSVYSIEILPPTAK